MSRWKTRKRGTLRQVGSRFPVSPISLQKNSYDGSSVRVFRTKPKMWHVVLQFENGDRDDIVEYFDVPAATGDDAIVRAKELKKTPGEPSSTYAFDAILGLRQRAGELQEIRGYQAPLKGTVKAPVVKPPPVRETVSTTTDRIERLEEKKTPIIEEKPKIDILEPISEPISEKKESIPTRTSKLQEISELQEIRGYQASPLSDHRAAVAESPVIKEFRGVGDVSPVKMEPWEYREEQARRGILKQETGIKRLLVEGKQIAGEWNAGLYVVQRLIEQQNQAKENMLNEYEKAKEEHKAFVAKFAGELSPESQAEYEKYLADWVAYEKWVIETGAVYDENVDMLENKVSEFESGKTNADEYVAEIASALKSPEEGKMRSYVSTELQTEFQARLIEKGLIKRETKQISEHEFEDVYVLVKPLEEYTYDELWNLNMAGFDIDVEKINNVRILIDSGIVAKTDEGYVPIGDLSSNDLDLLANAGFEVSSELYAWGELKDRNLIERARVSQDSWTVAYYKNGVEKTQDFDNESDANQFLDQQKEFLSDTVTYMGVVMPREQFEADFPGEVPDFGEELFPSIVTNRVFSDTDQYVLAKPPQVMTAEEIALAERAGFEIPEMKKGLSVALYEWGEKAFPESDNWKNKPVAERTFNDFVKSQTEYYAALAGTFFENLTGPYRWVYKFVTKEDLPLTQSVTASTLKYLEDLSPQQQACLYVGGAGAAFLGSYVAMLPAGMAAKAVLGASGLIASKIPTAFITSKISSISLAGRTFQITGGIAKSIASNSKLMTAIVVAPMVGMEVENVYQRYLDGEDMVDVLGEASIRAGALIGGSLGFERGLRQGFPVEHGKVDVPLKGGGKVSWEGYYVNYGDDAYRLTGDINFYDDAGRLLDAVDDKAKILAQGGVSEYAGEGRYIPESRIDARIVIDSLDELGYGPEEIQQINDVRKIISATKGIQSNYIEDILPLETNTLSSEGVGSLKEFLLTNSDEVEEVYGSFATRNQLNTAYEYTLSSGDEIISALRKPGDIDILLKTSEDKVDDFIQRLLDDLLGAGENVRINSENPRLIEAYVGNDRWAHAVDIHTMGEVHPDVLPDISWGFGVKQPSIRIEGLPVESLGEQGVRKGVSILGFTDDFSLGPLAHRMKDKVDFIQVARSLEDSKAWWARSVQGEIDRLASQLGVENITVGDVMDVYDGLDKARYAFYSSTGAGVSSLNPTSYLASLGLLYPPVASVSASVPPSLIVESEVSSLPEYTLPESVAPSEYLISLPLVSPISSVPSVPSVSLVSSVPSPVPPSALIPSKIRYPSPIPPKFPSPPVPSPPEPSAPSTSVSPVPPSLEFPSPSIPSSEIPSPSILSPPETPSPSLFPSETPSTPPIAFPRFSTEEREPEELEEPEEPIPYEVLFRYSPETKDVEIENVEAKTISEALRVGYSGKDDPREPIRVRVYKKGVPVPVYEWNSPYYYPPE